MICIKTGGIITMYDGTRGYSCDLHVVGDCIVAHTSGDPMHIPDILRLRKLKTLEIADGVNFFEMSSKRDTYGTIVVKAIDCNTTESFRKHIEEFYPNLKIRFRDWSHGL